MVRRRARPSPATCKRSSKRSNKQTDSIFCVAHHVIHTSIKNSTPKVRMDYWFIAYIVICICVGGGLVAQLYNREQTIGAMVLLVLCIAIFAFFGLRWFQGGELKGSKPAAQQWPPIVNLCPDFMAAVKGTDGTTAPAVGNPASVNTYCYDPSNTYSLNTSGLTQFVPTGATAAVSGFKIATGGTNPTYPLMSATSIVSVTTNTNNQRMRWEGVWDGRNFNAAMMPKPTL